MVQSYLNGEGGYKALTRSLGIPQESIVRRWVQSYKALKEAVDKTADCQYRRTFHSDQGWAYQMGSYQKTLRENKIFQSISHKGNCLDNSPMENCFGILKQEMYRGKMYSSFEEQKETIECYIYYYNHHRIKSKLGWKSPVQYREMNTLKIV